MLVRRVGGPVPAGGQYLHGDQPVGQEGLGGAEVVDLPARRPCAAQLDRNLVSGDVTGRQPLTGPGGRQREPAAVGGTNHGLRVAGQVGEVGNPVKDVTPAVQREPLPAASHRGGPGQRQHDDLIRAGPQLELAAGGQFEHAQAAVGPAGRLRGDGHDVRAGRGAAVPDHGGEGGRGHSISPAARRSPQAGASAYRPVCSCASPMLGSAVKKTGRPHDRFDLAGGGHRVGAGEPGGHDGPGGVAEP